MCTFFFKCSLLSTCLCCTVGQQFPSYSTSSALSCCYGKGLYHYHQDHKRHHHHHHYHQEDTTTITSLNGANTVAQCGISTLHSLSSHFLYFTEDYLISHLCLLLDGTNICNKPDCRLGKQQGRILSLISLVLFESCQCPFACSLPYLSFRHHCQLSLPPFLASALLIIQVCFLTCPSYFHIFFKHNKNLQHFFKFSVLFHYFFFTLNALWTKTFLLFDKMH